MRRDESHTEAKISYVSRIPQISQIYAQIVFSLTDVRLVSFREITFWQLTPHMSLHAAPLLLPT